MGTSSVSITGNDTAHDLRSEYTAAFFYYDIPEAVKKIDEYVRREMCDESDEEEWCNYMYSLADFMWNKGILTDDVRDKAIGMIDSGFGLELWEEAGTKTLVARKKSLSDFRTKLLSAMPQKKKIRPNVYTKKIFEEGDLIAIQLQTAGKPYTSKRDKEISDDVFHSMDGKYILMQLIKCESSWHSSIVPEVNDYWATFRLFDGVYDEIPLDINMNDLKDAKLSGKSFSPFFYCESSMMYFRRRNYKWLGCYKDATAPSLDKGGDGIFLGINNSALNPDSKFLAGMGKEIQCEELAEPYDCVEEICYWANRCGRYRYDISRAENEEIFAQENRLIMRKIKDDLAENGKIFKISFGVPIGIVTVSGSRVDNLYILCNSQESGFGTTLLRYALSFVGKGAYMDVPESHAALMHICEKIGMKKVEAERPDSVRWVLNHEKSDAHPQVL